MRAVVTGAAGFIGSQLAESLVHHGHHVLGVDCFDEYYDPALKRKNVVSLMAEPAFELVEDDLSSCDVEPLLDGAEIIYHHAAQPGVRNSFAKGFQRYCTNNVLVTQRVLEAAKSVGTPRVVFASSSSVYGNAKSYPTSEDDLPLPYSPYGVTKLAAEHLCSLYAANWGIGTVSLRYFTVYGPRQRPDMAIQRLFTSALDGQPFELYGDGRQERDFTYVGDVVDANLLLIDAAVAPGTVINVTGGANASLLDVIAMVEEITGRQIPLIGQSGQAGDVSRTGGSPSRAQAILGWSPKVGLRDGLDRQLWWNRDRSL